MIVYFQFSFYKLFLLKQQFTSDLKSSCYFGKVTGKQMWWSPFSAIKGLHPSEFWIFFIEYLWVNTFVPLKLLWDLTGIMKAITVHLLLHFDSSPAELIMIWHTKQMNTLPNQLFQGFLWNNLAKKSQTFLGKYHPWSSVLITSQGNVSKTELRSRRSP